MSPTGLSHCPCHAFLVKGGLRARLGRKLFLPFQVLDIKKLEAPSPIFSDRYRLIVSDGRHYHQAMLAMQMNTLVRWRLDCVKSLFLLCQDC